MERARPFSRVLAFAQAISAALALPTMAQHIKLAELGEYRSRGKGLCRHSGKKWGPRSSGKYTGVTNGRRECERRVRQMFNAGLRTSMAIYDRNAA